MTLGKCLKGQPNVNTPLGSIRIFTSCGLVQCLHLRTIVFALRGPSKIIIPPFRRSLLEIIDFSDPFVILILKSNLTINARIWTWRRRRNIFDFGASKGGHERGVRRCAFVVF